ncbi:MAG: SigE family RNA polymerase sigma factor [Jiangellaceae bacterium]
MDDQSKREFSDFVAARSRTLLGLALVLTADQHHAEDLVQGALTKLAGRWRKVDDPGAYVRRILYHDQISWWRRRARLREEPVASAPDRPASDASIQVDRRLDLRAALLRLGPRQRAVLVMHYFEDLPEAEIADALGCSVGTVRSQKHRALARLRVLAPELAEPFTPAPETVVPEVRR